MYVPSETAIVNLALLYVGERQTIDDLDEDTQPARVAKRFWPFVRNQLLEVYDWSFARKRVVLALTADDEERAEWAYIYALPTDCLAPRRLVTGNQVDSADSRIPFDVELGTRGKILLTDLAEAKLVYTREPETPALFSAAFCEALAWALAPRLALGLALKVDVARVLQPQAALTLAQAIANDRNQAQEGQPLDASSIRARG